MNQQRELIYSQRRSVLLGEDVHTQIMDMVDKAIEEAAAAYCSDQADPSEWDIKGLEEYCLRLFNIKGLFNSSERKGNIKKNEIIKRIKDAAQKKYQDRENDITEAGIDMREIERVVLLRSVDTHWMDHIDNMDQLRQGVRLRAYGQRDPVIEYKMEGFDMFEEMIAGIQEETVRSLYNLNVKSTPKREQIAREAQEPLRQANEISGGQKKPVVSGKKPGRNDPCPCGSGKKYKNCCGKEV